MLCQNVRSELNFNGTNVDGSMEESAVKLFSDDLKILAWRVADNLLPMYYIRSVVDDFQILLVGLFVILIGLLVCSYYMAALIFTSVLAVVSITVQTLYVIFVLSHFSRSFH